MLSYYLQSQMNKALLVSKNLSPLSWWETCIYFFVLFVYPKVLAVWETDWGVGVVQVVDNDIRVNVGKGWFPFQLSR